MLEVFHEELRNIGTHLFKVGEELSPTLNDVLGENVLFPVYPEVIKRFLCTVKDLREVGALRAELFEHLLVEDLI